MKPILFAVLSTLASGIAYSAPPLDSAIDNAENALTRMDHASRNTSVPCAPTTSAQKPGCFKMVEDFCGRLYSPTHLGNLGNVHLGRTKNDIDEAEYAYDEAKIKFQDRLPKDFLSELKKHGYFTLLKRWLHRKPPEHMSAQDAVADSDLYDQITAVWNQAQDHVVFVRTIQQFPEYAQQRVGNVPPALGNSQAKIASDLTEQISRAIWEEHPNWKKAVNLVSKIKKAFAETIQGMSDMEDATKKRWIEKIYKIKLLLPNQDRLHGNVLESCESTMVNAFYYNTLNEAVICAGLFNGEDPLHVIAHEFSHALDVGSSIYDSQAHSELGKAVLDLKRKSCNKPPLNCKDWEHWKEAYRSKIETIGNEKAPMMKTLSCLQDKSFRKIDSSLIHEQATNNANAEVDGVATAHQFQLLTDKEVLLGNGKRAPNPSYLNPCGLNAPNENMGLYSDTLYDFFVHEFRCQPSRSDGEKMTNAITVAKNMETVLIDALIPAGGRYATNPWMEEQGFAQNTQEKFADLMGMKVAAKVLRERPSLDTRRNDFLAGIAFLCDKPDQLAKQNFEKAIAEKKFSSESHSLRPERIKQLLIKPIRDELGCEKDFSSEECDP